MESAFGGFSLGDAKGYILEREDTVPPSRRDLNLLLTLFAAQSSAKAGDAVLPSRCYPFESLVEKTNEKTDAQFRQVFTGITHEGFPLDLHITTMPPGQVPHPAHHHIHEEMMMLQQGKLEVTISGKTTVVGPGSVIYIHSNEEHGLKSVGEVPAQYFVLAVGHQVQARS